MLHTHCRIVSHRIISAANLSRSYENTYITWFGDEGAQIAEFHEWQKNVRVHIVVYDDRCQPHDVFVIEISHQHRFHQELHSVPHAVTVCCKHYTIERLIHPFIHTFICCLQ